MILKALSAIVLVAVAGVLGAAATRPDSFRVARSTTVQAPPERLHGLIADLRQFKTWNPFDRDPASQGSYRGPAAGVGAAYDFAGGSAGDGSLRIVDATPSRVTMELHMRKPLETRNNVQFTLQPRDGGTEVTWAMDGPMPFVSKVMTLFVDMDRMLGGQFESGLADLKRAAERR